MKNSGRSDMGYLERTEQAVVSVNVCVCCKKETRIGAVIGGEDFDPRSRTAGLPHADLWPDHPNHERLYCYPCLERGAHVHPAHPPALSGVVRIALWAADPCRACHGKGCEWNVARENGCQSGRVVRSLGLDEGYGMRLPSAPPDEAFWSKQHAGLLLSASDYALLVLKLCGHWRPIGPIEALTYAASTQLADGSLLALLDKAPYPTVLELTCNGTRDIEQVRRGYGSEAARRAGAREGALEVQTKVPLDLLQ